MATCIVVLLAVSCIAQRSVPVVVASMEKDVYKMAIDYLDRASLIVDSEISYVI